MGHQDGRRDPGHLREPDRRRDRVARAVSAGRRGPDHLPAGVEAGGRQGREGGARPLGIRVQPDLRRARGPPPVLPQRTGRRLLRGPHAGAREARLGAEGTAAGRRPEARSGRHRTRPGVLVHGRRSVRSRDAAQRPGLGGALRPPDGSRRRRGVQRGRHGARVPGRRGSARPAPLRRRCHGRRGGDPRRQHRRRRQDHRVRGDGVRRPRPGIRPQRPRHRGRRRRRRIPGRLPARGRNGDGPGHVAGLDGRVRRSGGTTFGDAGCRATGRRRLASPAGPRPRRCGRPYRPGVPPRRPGRRTNGARRRRGGDALRREPARRHRGGARTRRRAQRPGKRRTTGTACASCRSTTARS